MLANCGQSWLLHDVNSNDSPCWLRNPPKLLQMKSDVMVW
jgi:hypothetical protein